MKTPRALLLAATALTAILGLPALASISAPRDTAMATDDRTPAPLRLASDDDDDHRRRNRHHDDDDDDDDDDSDDDDDDNDHHRRSRSATPAPAGPLAPPANGLFGTGAPPRVQMN